MQGTASPSPDRRLAFRLLVATTLGAVAVLACGPFFGIEALQSRRETLLASPTISFEAELATLVPTANDKLPVVEFEDCNDCACGGNPGTG